LRVIAEAEGYQFGIGCNGDGKYQIHLRRFIASSDTRVCYVGEWEPYRNGTGSDEDESLIIRRFAKRLAHDTHPTATDLYEAAVDHINWTLPESERRYDKEKYDLLRSEGRVFWAGVEDRVNVTTWKRGTYTIRDIEGGSEDVVGHVSRHFGITGTATRGKVKDVWTITHLPTGFKVGPKFSSLFEAKLHVMALQSPGLDWSFTDPKAITPAMHSRVAAIRDAWNEKLLPVTEKG